MTKSWVVLYNYGQSSRRELPSIYEIKVLENKELSSYKEFYEYIEITKSLIFPDKHWSIGMKTHMSKRYIHHDKISAIKAHKKQALEVKEIIQQQFNKIQEQLTVIAECDYSCMQDETYISPFDGEIK